MSTSSIATPRPATAQNPSMPGLAGWFWLHNSILDAGLKADDIVLLACLARHANSDGVCWPSVRTISRMTRMVDDERIGRARQRLEARGLLDVEQRLRDNGSLSTNRWKILSPATQTAQERFKVPNAIFNQGLDAGAIALCLVLIRLEGEDVCTARLAKMAGMSRTAVVARRPLLSAVLPNMFSSLKEVVVLKVPGLATQGARSGDTGPRSGDTASGFARWMAAVPIATQRLPDEYWLKCYRIWTQAAPSAEAADRMIAEIAEVVDAGGAFYSDGSAFVSYGGEFASTLHEFLEIQLCSGA